MEKSLLTEVKAILKSLVLSCPEKITIEQLNRDYRDVEGQFIPFRQLGYENIEKFLRSIPDTIRVFGTGPTAMVCFVANEKSDHIHDMIMKQKKPTRSAKSVFRSKSASRNKSNAFQRNNMLHTKKTQPAKTCAQQLSPYQSVNRNYMAKTAQVRDLSHFVQTAYYQQPVLYNPLLYGLPQPNNLLLNNQHLLNYTHNPVLSSIRNGLIKPIGNQSQQYEKNLSQVNDLLRKQCYVSKPPPPIPRHQSRTVKFCSETKSSVKVDEKIQQESVKEENSKMKISEETITETKSLPIQIKVPRAKKHIPIKLSDDVENLLTMPKLCKATNPIEVTSKHLSGKTLQKENYAQNTKSVNEAKTSQYNRFFDDSADIVEDPDEAVPSFAAKNNVFRLDFPEDTVSYGKKIAPYKITDEVTVGTFLKVFITEIHNPFKFWFHIHTENNELDTLMYQIEHFYSSLTSEDLCIPMVCLTPGQVCAACYKGLWHRAEIVAPPVNANVKVSFMDYGTVTEVEIVNIKFLVSYFAQLPAQALRGCLSHIKPREPHWSHEATTYFLTLVMDLMLYAKITEVDKENNGKRIRHPREDFPTFSMIESGEYPSFGELVSLQQRGIDYEGIYDAIIYNQSSILNKHECASERLRNLPYFLTTSNPFRSDILFELYSKKTSTAI